MQAAPDHLLKALADRMEQSGFRPQEPANDQGANYAWQRFIGGLEHVVAGLN
jgi:hypothetical protein